MSSGQVLVITESESYEFDVGNYSITYIERAVKTYERKQETAKAYYARMREDPEWVQKQRERARAYRLKKKLLNQSSSSSSSSPSSASSSS